MGLFSKLNKKLKNSLNTNVDFIDGKLKKLMSERNIDEIRLLPSLEEDDRVCFTSSDNLRFKSGSEFFRFTRFALLNGEVFFKTQHVTLETIDDETEDWHPMQELEAGLKSGEIDPEFFELYDLWLWIEKNPATWSEIPRYVDKKVIKKKAFIAKIQKMIGEGKSENARLNRTLSEASSILEKYKSQNATLKEKYASLQSSELQELEDSIQRYQAELDNLKDIPNQLVTSKNELERITSLNLITKGKIDKLKNELEQLSNLPDSERSLLALLYDNEKDILPVELSEKIQLFL